MSEADKKDKIKIVPIKVEGRNACSSCKSFTGKSYKHKEPNCKGHKMHVWQYQICGEWGKK